MTTLSLLLLGAAPALALVVARRLASGDVAASMRRHRQALSVLAELTGGGSAKIGS